MEDRVVCFVLLPSVNAKTRTLFKFFSVMVDKMENVSYLKSCKFLEPSSLYEGASLLLVSGRIVTFSGKSGSPS